MVNLNACKDKPTINYPCFWEYKLIFESTQNVELIVKEVLEQREFSLEIGRKSTHAKYESYLLKVYVDSEADRLHLFNAFKERAKFVL